MDVPEVLYRVDPAVAAAIEAEEERQQASLELIASENMASPAVMAAAGSVMTNKYAEGYPGYRYYAGCEHMDTVEQLARERACRLFGADHANVQPHSGSQANTAVYFALLEPGDTMLGMSLSHGGHLTHGHPINISGRYYQVVHYGVSPDTGRIDYDQVRDLARKNRPRLVVAGASAYPRALDFSAFRAIADEVGACLMVDMAHIAGLVAAGYHANPCPVADFVTTTTHKTLRGPRGGMVFCRSEYAELLDRAVFPGIQGGPLMHLVAAKAVALQEALQPDFQAYQGRVVENARVLGEALTARRWQLVSGGTDNHLLLLDLRDLAITGKEAEGILHRSGITLNKNAVPGDPRGPAITSGIRLGTPAVTTRGMGPGEMEQIAGLIDEVLRHPAHTGLQARIRSQVARMCRSFPLYMEPAQGAGDRG